MRNDSINTWHYLTFITINSPWNDFSFTHCTSGGTFLEFCVRNFHNPALTGPATGLPPVCHPLLQERSSYQPSVTPHQIRMWMEATFLWPRTGSLSNRVSENANINSCMERVLKCSHFGSLGSILKVDCWFYFDSFLLKCFICCYTSINLKYFIFWSCQNWCDVNYRTLVIIAIDWWEGNWEL